MHTNPSPDTLLEGVIISLSNDVMPNVTNAKAQATVAMAQSLLPHYQEYLVEEHNAMTAVLRGVAQAIGGSTGAAADRLRAMAADLGARPDLPTPLDPALVMSAHKTLSESLVDCLKELDVLQRAGDTRADDALQVIRGHLGPRYLRDVQTLIVGAGMIGRG